MYFSIHYLRDFIDLIAFGTSGTIFPQLNETESLIGRDDEEDEEGGATQGARMGDGTGNSNVFLMQITRQRRATYAAKFIELLLSCKLINVYVWS